MIKRANKSEYYTNEENFSEKQKELHRHLRRINKGQTGHKRMVFYAQALPNDKLRITGYGPDEGLSCVVSLEGNRLIYELY